MYRSPNIIRVIESRGLGWAGNVAHERLRRLRSRDIIEEMKLF